MGAGRAHSMEGGQGDGWLRVTLGLRPVQGGSGLKLQKQREQGLFMCELSRQRATVQVSGTARPLSCPHRRMPLTNRVRTHCAGPGSGPPAVKQGGWAASSD